MKNSQLSTPNSQLLAGFTPLEVRRPAAPAAASGGLPLTGFTLIELLVVLTIVGILASIILVSLQQVRAKARDAKRISDVRQLLLAAELFQDDHLTYPQKGAIGTVVSLPDLAPYLTPLPTDPGSTPLACRPEGYRWQGNDGHAQQYCLWACLEQGGVFAASSKGTARLDLPPSSLDCW